MMIGRKLVRMSTREWALTALVGVAWFAVYSVALNAGEQHVDAGTASMLIQFAPILIGVLAGILLGEGFPRMLVIGGLVAFAGTLLIGFATSTGEADLAGVLLVLLSATVYSIAMVAQKVVLRRIPALQVTWLACLIGTVACLPFAGDLVRDLAVRTRSADSGSHLPRAGADCARLLDLGVRAQPALGRKAGCHDIRRTTDHDPARLALPWRGAADSSDCGRCTRRWLVSPSPGAVSDCSLRSRGSRSGTPNRASA